MEHSLETLKSCPSCGHNFFQQTLSCTDFTYSKDSFAIVECDKCTLLFTNPRPDEKTIGKYYDSAEYVSHTDTKSGLLFTLYGLVKGFTLKQKRGFLDRISKEKSVLDYGAGSGDFSSELADNGWAVSSFEPDPNARKKITEKNPKITLVNNLTDVDSKSKSAITLWHVLEHVHRLQDTIDEFHRILKQDGTLIIAVPNHTSYDASFYENNWAAYDVPRHLYHFNPTTIETLMMGHGFRLAEIKPMWFDSFYVSLLSEKNSGSSGVLKTAIGWTRALLIGSLSNIRALGTNAHCSSVTYVFKKVV